MRAVGFLLLVLLQLAAPASAQDTSPLGLTAKTWRPLLSLPGAAQNQRPEAGQKLAQMCPFGWGFCPGGFCAPLGSVCCPGGYCQQGQSCCGSQCCNAGAYCSRVGCVPVGSVECGTGYCNPGFKCAGFNRCIPFDAMDCGDGRHCNPGFRCASGNTCISQDAVDCGNGRSCRAGFLCVGADRCMTQQQIDFEQAEQERRRLEAERRTQEQAAEQRRLAELRQLAENTQRCSQYVVARCDAALASPHVGAGERERLVAWRTTAFKFASDRADCRGGSASACNAALASPALAEADRAELERWRAQTSLMYRTLAFVRETAGSAATSAQSLVETVRNLPTSTHVAGGVAIGLGLALIALLAVRRRGMVLPPPPVLSSEAVPSRAPPPPPPPASVSAEQIGGQPSGSLEDDPQILPPQPPREPPKFLLRSGSETLPASDAVAASAIRKPPSARPAAILGNGPTFVILYLLLMVPTYFLPYLGSNSMLLNTTGAAMGLGFNPAFWIHLVALAGLVAIGYSRATLIGKRWLTIFPFLALVFDLTPGLNFIPLVPTIMHLLMIILGVSLAPSEPLPIPAGAGIVRPSQASVGEGQHSIEGYNQARFEALLNYDSDIKAAADRVRPLGEKWVAVLALDYLTLNAKEYLPSIVSKIEAGAAREEEEIRNRPYVVEEGTYRNRKWRRLNTGVIEGEMLNGGMRNFESLEEFQRFVG